MRANDGWYVVMADPLAVLPADGWPTYRAAAETITARLYALTTDADIRAGLWLVRMCREGR